MTPSKERQAGQPPRRGWGWGGGPSIRQCWRGENPLGCQNLSPKRKRSRSGIEGDLGRGRAEGQHHLNHSPWFSPRSVRKPGCSHICEPSAQLHMSLVRRLLRFQEPCEALECLPVRNWNIKRFKGGWKNPILKLSEAQHVFSVLFL